MGRLCLACMLWVAVGTAAADVKGTVKKVDLATGVLVVKPHAAGPDLELSLAGRDVPVTDVVGRPARLGDVRVGSRVALTQTGEYVTAVQLDGPAVWGVLRKIDPATRTVEVEDPVRTHTVRLPEGAKVVVSRVEKAFADVKVGQPARVAFAPDGKTPALLAVGSGVSSRDPYRKYAKVEGVLLEADPAARTVTLLLKTSGEPLRTETFATAADVAVKLNLAERRVRDGDLAAVKAGPLTVRLVLDPETRVVDGFEVELPAYARRKLVAVDDGKVTIDDPKSPLSLALDPAVAVWTPDGPGTVKDLKSGKSVTVALSPDRTRVLVVQIHSR